MVIKREVASGIVRGLSEFWKCEELYDFTVKLDRTRFKCHRLLLAACSGFFRGLFRSGMKETELKCVSVEDISSETFELILETLYTGRGVLTKDNVIDIWRAAHQLQILFLITECEHFVVKSLSLENYVEYFQNGKLLSSQPVTEAAWSFILKHCNSFFKTSTFFELPVDELLKLVKSQELAVKSENDVHLAILKWTEYRSYGEQHLTTLRELRCKRFQAFNVIKNKNNNESHDTTQYFGSNVMNPNDEKQVTSEEAIVDTGNRDQHLGILFSNARTCLASHECLEMLLCNPLVSDNKMARDVVTKALLYQLHLGKRNGQWPTAAIHRNNSQVENVAIRTKRTDNGGLKLQAFSFQRNKWLKLNIGTLKPRDYFAVCAIDNSLYYLFLAPKEGMEDRAPLSVFQMTEKAWSERKTSLTLNFSDFYVAVVNEFIYIIQSSKNEMWRLQPVSGKVVPLTDLPDDLPICHVTCCEHWIFLFYSNTVEGVDETMVQCYDTTQNTWTQLNNLEGPANGMTSFKDDNYTYLLQSSGDLWKMVKPQSDVLDFEYVVKLWSYDWALNGAVTFMDQLYIYGVKSETLSDDPQIRKCLPGVFSQIVYLESNSVETTQFLPITLSRKCMIYPYIQFYKGTIHV